MPTKKGSTSESRQAVILRKKIAALRLEMEKTGKRYLACEACGKKGPMIAHTDAKSGHLVFHQNSRVKYWAFIIVFPEGLGLPNRPVNLAHAYVTLCPQCAKARRKQLVPIKTLQLVKKTVKSRSQRAREKARAVERKLFANLTPEQKKFLEERRRKRRRARDYDGSRRVTI